MNKQESGQRRIPRLRRSEAVPLAAPLALPLAPLALPLADPPELLALPLADPPELLALPLADPLVPLAGLAVAEVEEKQKGKVNQFLRY